VHTNVYCRGLIVKWLGQVIKTARRRSIRLRSWNS